MNSWPSKFWEPGCEETAPVLPKEKWIDEDPPFYGFPTVSPGETWIPDQIIIELPLS